MAKKKVCSFCGRDESQVNLIISGLHGFICDDCAKQAYEIAETTGAYGSAAANKKPSRRYPSPAKSRSTSTSMS